MHLLAVDLMMMVGVMVVAPWSAMAQGADKPQNTGDPVIGSPTCEWAALPSKVARFNRACCHKTPAAGSKGKGTQLAVCKVSCDLRCAAELFRLTDGCMPILNALFDGADGKEDGSAAVLAHANATCAGMKPTVLLTQIRELQAQGRCTAPNLLDGVAETAVRKPHAPTCVDKMTSTASGLNPCTALVGTGEYSCEHDLCPRCKLAHHCDKTCHICGGGKHRLRRRTQVTQACPFSKVEADLKRVNAACCDSKSCVNGAPRTCDAKCALYFVDVYDRCSRLIEATSQPKEVLLLTAVHSVH